MANDLAQIESTVFRKFHEALAAGTTDFERVGPVLSDDSPNLEIQMDQSTGTLQVYTAVGQDVNKDIKSANVVFSSSGHAKTEKITWKDLRDNPNLPARRATTMANEAMAYIHEIFHTGLASLFSAAHPMAGANSWQVGAGKVYLDTDLAYNGGTQSNLLSLALSRAALVTADKTFGSWRRVGSGMKLNLGNALGQKVLVAHPDQRDLVTALLGSPAQDANLQKNMLMDWASPVFYPLTAANDYFVVCRGVGQLGGPVGMWMREKPMVQVQWSSASGGLDLVMSVRCIADFWYDVEGAGIVGYNAP